MRPKSWPATRSDPRLAPPPPDAASDFDWLREKLRHELVGLYIPALPPKKMIGNQGERLSRVRQASLVRDC